jgi:hypothetical protein
VQTPSSTKEIKMLNTPLPEEVRTTLLKYHIVQDDLLDVQVLLDVIEDLPDGARYLPLGPGSTDPGRDPDDLSPKEKLEVLIQSLECYVHEAQHHVNQQLVVLRKRYPNYHF